MAGVPVGPRKLAPGRVCECPHLEDCKRSKPLILPLFAADRAFRVCSCRRLTAFCLLCLLKLSLCDCVTAATSSHLYISICLVFNLRLGPAHRLLANTSPSRSIRPQRAKLSSLSKLITATIINWTPPTSGAFQSVRTCPGRCEPRGRRETVAHLVLFVASVAVAGVRHCLHCLCPAFVDAYCALQYWRDFAIQLISDRNCLFDGANWTVLVRLVVHEPCDRSYAIHHRGIQIHNRPWQRHPSPPRTSSA